MKMKGRTIPASGLELVEYRCTICEARWWVAEGEKAHCEHPFNVRPTGFKTHVRTVDF